ncbi:hypothetical protein KY363_05240 [Candidatus Woesearchaeota archaeon]|nr:hypothetical protein [Candidatus Woesearchaeota archaeon]
MPAKKKKAAKPKKPAEDVEETAESGPREVKRQKTCPDCGSNNVSYDTENEAMICGDCGAIFEEFVVMDSKDEIELF